MTFLSDEKKRTKIHDTAQNSEAKLKQFKAKLYRRVQKVVLEKAIAEAKHQDSEQKHANVKCSWQGAVLE